MAKLKSIKNAIKLTKSDSNHVVKLHNISIAHRGLYHQSKNRSMVWLGDTKNKIHLSTAYQWHIYLDDEGWICVEAVNLDET
jgi:hypothetical protein